MKHAGLSRNKLQAVQPSLTDQDKKIKLSVSPASLITRDTEMLEEIMPMDGGIARKELEASQVRITFLEKENLELRQEVARLRAQVTTLKAHDVERKSMLWKKLQSSTDAKTTDRSQHKQTFAVEKPEPNLALEEKKGAREDLIKPAAHRERQAKSVKLALPGPIPESNGNRLLHAPAAAPPPPPPPLPSKLLGRSKTLRRAPEVVEFYRALMKRDAQKENRAGSTGHPPILSPKNMIGEIENRSTYLLNIKSDVETHGELVSFLSREVQDAAFADISEVESFVKWLDGQLSCLVDERAVLKHFPQWPERKADALREAACSYREMKNLESEVSSYKDNPKQQLTESLRKMQALQDRLEKSTNNIERVREGMSKKYRELHIPWAWMLDTGVIGQLKFSSVALARQYMKRIAKELESSGSVQDDDLLIQGVRFAYRVHQAVLMQILCSHLKNYGDFVRPAQHNSEITSFSINADYNRMSLDNARFFVQV
ncbi:INCREASED PETAL GROWTH ANISOTROPY 1-like protein 1 isoform X1 [Coffea arabica]|uniref:INCREASED PETAL GROWTH ANISOTROPY 1-like protein 1 isoform X1 n=1 Tax=Coffea arabica TaxID=13443 RepID=A0ABM4WUY4_COFAR